MSILFGKYAVHSKLACGGMADIYLATARGPQGFTKTVVLKRLFPHLAENPDILSMFFQEARIVAQLHHPNIIQVFEVGQHEDNYYLCMEYLAGKNLSAILTHSQNLSRPLPIEIVAQIGSSVAHGLSYAHCHLGADGNINEIVHGDISPSNIVVTFVGEVKIVDFGIAKTHSSPSARKGVPQSIQGKLGYLAPEQLKYLPADHRADLFSLGIVLYEMISGQRLFRRNSDCETVKAILQAPIPSPRAFREDIPFSFAKIIMKALERKPENRFQFAEEMANALDEFLLQRAWTPSPTKLSLFLSELFGEKSAQKALTIPFYESTASITCNTSHLPSWKPIGKIKAIPLISETSTRPKKGKQLVRVVGEFPAALFKAGQELVAVPLNVVQFACTWTKQKVSLAAIAFALFGFGMGLTFQETVLDDKPIPSSPETKAADPQSVWAMPSEPKTEFPPQLMPTKHSVSSAHLRHQKRRPRLGKLEISGHGKAYVQDSLLGKAPLSKHLPPGSYTVILMDFSGKVQRQWIAVVKPGKTTRL